MAESTIITGQFVRISQTPASIGERLMALIIDYFLIGLYHLCPLLRSLSKLQFTVRIQFVLFSVRRLFADSRLFFSLRNVQSRTELSAKN